MASPIKADVLQALADWKDGKPVRTLELGHVHRMKDVPGFSPAIDASRHLHQDQERAHAYCFFLIEWFSDHGPVPAGEDAYERFVSICDMLEKQFRKTGGQFAGEGYNLTAEELDGAESLAWKALRFGWVRAIEGHKDSMYITVTNPAAQVDAT